MYGGGVVVNTMEILSPSQNLQFNKLIDISKEAITVPDDKFHNTVNGKCTAGPPDKVLGTQVECIQRLKSGLNAKWMKYAKISNREK